MTGFGRGEFSNEFGYFTAEIKSVNSKACNIIVKLPETLSSFDIQVSNYVRSRISRGQINILINHNRNGLPAGNKVVIDRELAKEYYDQLSAISDYLLIKNPASLDTIVSLPGVINVVETEENMDEIWSAISNALTAAIDQLIKSREDEGMAILSDINDRLDIMSQVTDRIIVRAPEVVEFYRQRLQKKIGELIQSQIDESRIAMEISIMAERCDISEEIVRLRSHINQIQNSLKDSEGPVGRRLDFILQEINREINTISSKANDFQISSECIRFKEETEKIREQVQNIE